MSEPVHKKNIAVTSLVICEDVRQELFNKFSLIGVFSGDMAVAAFPANIRLAVFVETTAIEVKTYKMEIRILFNKSPVMGLMVEATPSGAGSSAIGTPAVNLSFANEGEITIEISIDGESAAIGTKKLIRSDIAPKPMAIGPNASEPPT